MKNCYYVNKLPTNKLTPFEANYLQKIFNWKIVDAWCIKGHKKIKISVPDNYTIYVIDTRFIKFKRKYRLTLNENGFNFIKRF